MLALRLTRTRSATAGEGARGDGKRGLSHRNLGRTPASVGCIARLDVAVPTKEGRIIIW